MTLLRGAPAAPPRTLVDVFDATVAAHPDEPALYSGAQVLTYAELAELGDALAVALGELGIGPGDRVGIRVRSGTTDLYVAILATLMAGAAYVPVDADDPDERARLVFAEAQVDAVIGADLSITLREPGADPVAPTPPDVEDDAWIIFTSGSTGTPKGVAVTHRSAAAFVDAEAGLYLQGAPVGPGDRVMAGLSVAFDASCEEIWLAWRHGACLVPAPRSLVRSGVELGPWLRANDLTVVSTVPTLVALWPMDALTRVRLLILGGEACPAELATRLVASGREVWNTYGPTEATVVSCGALLGGDGPIRIGLPLAGWDLAVVDADSHPVADGDIGELVIGGVGLARYLDPERDAERYAAMASLGWARAYRSGDLVRYDGQGLVFVGRADDQVKVGGRRIELGEIDSALLDLPGVTAAAAAVRHTGSGNALLVGYVATSPDFDPSAAKVRLRERLPAALVPRLVTVADLPTKTSGKIDRDALPWPAPSAAPATSTGLGPTQAQVAAVWLDVLGAPVESAADDFFDLGGGSLTAAQVVARLRAAYPELAVADVYEHPTLAALAEHLDGMSAPSGRLNRAVNPVPRKTQIGQLAFSVALRSVGGARWLTWAAAVSTAGSSVLDLPWLPTVAWWWVALGWLLLVFPPGRMLLAAAGARALLRGVGPGQYPRGGRIHLRVWLAERFADECNAAGLSGAVLMPWYARLLGARIGPNVDLHTVPPITGRLHVGAGASLEPEVDLRGHWLDGDVLTIAPIRIGPRARIGARSTLAPGADVGADAEVGPGSGVLGTVPDGQYWAGAPAEPVGRARGPWEGRRPAYRWWYPGLYAATAAGLAGLPLVAVLAGLALPAWSVRGAPGPREAAATLAAWLPLTVVVAGVVLALLVLAVVRLAGLALRPGHHPVHSRPAWAAWATIRVLDEARTWLFPLYSSSLTPAWLRALGARIGPDVEASTVLLLPRLTSVGAASFLADDTLLGGYELGGGWLRIDQVKVGRQAFLGNSGMTAPGRKVPREGLVAVLSAAPRRARRGTSWLGSPPTRLRRAVEAADAARTYRPPARLRVARAAIEVCRVIPVILAAGLGAGASAVLLALAAWIGWWLALLAGGLVLIVQGAVAAGIATAAKWLLVGRVRPSEHPLWSTFVWRNELADTALEVLAAPWFARPALGTPALNIWLRSMGARIGPGVWCESYWLPEPDLVDLRAGATVGAGCVVQTHLFHDRVLALDTVTLREGATLGPNGVVLPAAVIGSHATVGPASLVMRGESVPDKTRWVGNPIGPWDEDQDRHSGGGAP
ncbi:MAG: Pls/PosA family non-ribosomal peptide synthetase [Dermatophilaceae bacterium]